MQKYRFGCPLGRDRPRERQLPKGQQSMDEVTRRWMRRQQTPKNRGFLAKAIVKEDGGRLFPDDDANSVSRFSADAPAARSPDRFQRPLCPR